MTTYGATDGPNMATRVTRTYADRCVFVLCEYTPISITLYTNYGWFPNRLSCLEFRPKDGEPHAKGNDSVQPYNLPL